MPTRVFSSRRFVVSGMWWGRRDALARIAAAALRPAAQPEAASASCTVPGPPAAKPGGGIQVASRWPWGLKCIRKTSCRLLASHSQKRLEWSVMGPTTCYYSNRTPNCYQASRSLPWLHFFLEPPGERHQRFCNEHFCGTGANGAALSLNNTNVYCMARIRKRK